MSTHSPPPLSPTASSLLKTMYALRRDPSSLTATRLYPADRITTKEGATANRDKEFIFPMYPSAFRSLRLVVGWKRWWEEVMEEVEVLSVCVW